MSTLLPSLQDKCTSWNSYQEDQRYGTIACLSTALDPTTKGSPVATLVQEFPIGAKVPIKFTAAVQSRSPRPFKFAAFKAAYRAAGTSKTFQTFDPCEIDSSKCEEDEDQPDNAKFGGNALYNKK